MHGADAQGHLVPEKRLGDVVTCPFPNPTTRSPAVTFPVHDHWDIAAFPNGAGNRQPVIVSEIESDHTDRAGENSVSTAMRAAFSGIFHL